MATYPMDVILNNDFLYCAVLKYHVYSKHFWNYATYNNGDLENLQFFLEN